MNEYIVFLFVFLSGAPVVTQQKIRRTQREIALKTLRNNGSIFYGQYVNVHVLP